MKVVSGITLAHLRGGTPFEGPEQCYYSERKLKLE